jgi:hypothetical protein
MDFAINLLQILLLFDIGEYDYFEVNYLGIKRRLINLI